MRAEDLVKRYRRSDRVAWRRQESSDVALAGVSFEIRRGEVFGLVGESGSGKTTIARCTVGLMRPDSGYVSFDGANVLDFTRRGLQDFRRRAQIVPQDPSGSLDPRMTAERIVEEPLRIHHVRDRNERRARVREAWDRVGLSERGLGRRPHEFSGGQRQRIALARALVLRPEFLVLDEPVSALDVSIQAQVLNLLLSLRDALNLTYLVVVHDLAVAGYLCDRIGVLYRGRMVESGSATQILSRPKHSYTRELISAVPKLPE